MPNAWSKEKIKTDSTSNQIAISDEMTSFHKLNIKNIDIGEMSDLSFSPDGKYLAAVNAKRELIVITIESGEYKVLDKECQTISRIVWSPDGKYIAHDKKQIIIVNVESGEEKTLTAKTNPCIQDWSPDGKYILCVDWNYERKKSEKHEILIISTETNEVKRLETEHTSNWALRQHPRYSPDGEYIVYYTNESDKHILNIRKVDDTYHARYDDFLGVIRNPLWSPNGKNIIFEGTQGTERYLWSIQVNDGNFVGFPKMLFPISQNQKFVTCAGNQDLIYHLNYKGGIFLVPMNQETGKALGIPKRLARQEGGSFAISPDSKQLVSFGYGTNTVIAFLFYSIRNGQFLKEIPLYDFVKSGLVSYSSDNKHIVFDGTYVKDGNIREGLYSVDVNTFDQSQIFTLSGNRNYNSQYCSTTNTIAYENKGHIYLLRLGEDEPICVTTELNMDQMRYGGPSLSPDGEYVAFFAHDAKQKAMTINVITKDGKNMRELISLPNTPYYYHLSSCWSPNGKFIVFTPIEDGSDYTELCVIPSSGGDVYKVPIPNPA